MNILLSCVGRRNYMVDYFRSAVGPEGKVICTNSEKDATGMIVADKAYEMPPVSSKEYINVLLEIALKEDVKLIISLFDIDLPYLAAAKEDFAKHGITVVVSSPEVIELANDKWKTYNFLLENNFNTPKTFVSLADVEQALDKKEIIYPLFVKPRWGMGSIGIYKVNNFNELYFFYNYSLQQIKSSYLNILSHNEIERSILIQEYIIAQEFGLDVLNDLNSEYVTTVVKEKLAMRSGETDIATVVDLPELKAIGKKLSKCLKHIGNLDVDILYSKNVPYVLELNARFGGGYPFTHLAGADFPRTIVDWVKGLPTDPERLYPLVGVKGMKSISLISQKL